ncbi:hypothetical protein ABDH75_10925 [Bacillus wiedmannii]|uniref:hypothetical protein n=1 Tax=Bacillus wiedmannii TaxID=1890302 RepID=UPI003D224716
MTAVIEFIGNVLKTFGPLAIVFPFIFGYIYKNDLDIIFEQKQGRFFKNAANFIVAFLNIYFLLQITSFTLYLFIFAFPFLSHTIINLIAIILISLSILIYILYIYAWSFTQVEKNRETTKKKRYKLSKWIIDTIEKRTLFISVYIVFFTCSYFHALNIKILILKSENISKTIESNLGTFIGDPLFYVLFTGSVVCIYRFNKRPKCFYTMSLIDYDTLQKANKEELIHLYTRKDNQWILVEPKHRVTLKEVYLYNPDKDKWYFYKKIDETD